MMNMMNFQDSIIQLLSADMNDVHKALGDIRERIEIVHIPESASFFSTLFPEVLRLFGRLHTQFANTIENKCRALILDILYRLPIVDHVRQSASTIVLLAISVIANDNEDNALVAIKIIPNLHKAFRTSLADCVQPFLEVVCDIFRLMPQETIPKAYMPQPVIEMDQNDKSDDFSSQVHHSFNSSNRSFKVACELPSIIMLLLQLYPQHIHANIDRLIPTVATSLTISDIDSSFNSPVFRDLVTCRVKVINFLACLLKGFFEKVKPFEKLVVNSVMNLIMVCPSDMVICRRELLVATRHVLSTEFKQSFAHCLPLLLDEGWLVDGINCGPACCRKSNYLMAESREILRPIAYEIIADTLNNNSTLLTVHQIGVEIYMLTRSLASLSSSISIMVVSIQLLSFLIDRLHILMRGEAIINDSFAHSRRLLVHILESIVDLLGNHDRILLMAEECDAELNESLISIGKGGLKNCLKQISHLEEGVAGNKDSGWSNSLQSLSSSSISTLTFNRFILSSSTGMMEIDMKKCIKKLCRVVIDCMDAYCKRTQRNLNDTGILESKSSSSSMQIDHGNNKRDLSYSEHEIMMISKYFKLSLVFLRKIYQSPLSSHHGQAVSEQDMTELRDLVDGVCLSISHHDGSIVRAVFHGNIELLFQMISEHYLIFSLIPERMMLKYGHSTVLVDVIVQYTIRKLSILTRPIDRASTRDVSSNRQITDSTAATVLIKLIRLVFSSLSSPTCPSKDVEIVAYRLQELVLSCIRLAAESRYSVNYFLFLRTIFRSSAVLKYDLLQDKFIGILPEVIVGLYRLFLRTNHDAVAGLLMQLFFSIPLKIDRLLPHMPVLLRIVAKALRSRGELLENALRVFESWIDSTHSIAMLDAMNSQEGLANDVMMAIMEHLKPNPYPLGGLAMRIVGKIGGRSRQMLGDLSQGAWNHYSATSLLQAEQRSSSCDMSDLASSVLTINVPVSNDQTISLGMGPVVTASVELIDVLTMKPQVEAEVPSLMHSYPLPAQVSLNGLVKGFATESAAEPHALSKAYLTDHENEVVMKGIQLPKLADIKEMLNKLVVKEFEVNVDLDHNFTSVQSEIKQIVGETSSSTKQAAFSTICTVTRLIIGQDQSMVTNLEVEKPSLLLLRVLLKGVIMSLADDELSSQSSDLLKKVAQHCFDTGCHQDYCSIICSAMVDTMTDARPAVYAASYMAMKSLAAFFLQFGDASSNFIDSAFKAASNVVNIDQWISAVGCVRMIECLCDAFPPKIVENYECSLISSLFLILKACQRQFVTIACEDVFDCLRSLLHSCHAMPIPRSLSSSSFGVWAESLSPQQIAHEQESFVMQRPRSMSITTDIFINGQGLGPALSFNQALPPVTSIVLTPRLSACVDVLLKETFCSKTTVRLAAKMSLKLIGKHMNCDIGSLIQSLSGEYLDNCLTTDFFLMETNQAIGLISGFTYLVQHHGQAVDVTDRMTQVVAKVLKFALHYSDIPADKFPGKRSLAKDPSKDDFHGLNEDYNLLLSLYPAEIPISLQVRLCAIKFFQSLAVHGSHMFVSEKHSELRNAILQLLFRSIMETTWLEVMNNAQRAITQIVSVVRHSDAHAVGSLLSNEFFQPFVQMSQDVTSLSISKMSCLSRVLQLAAIKSPQLLPVFVHHLRSLSPLASKIERHTWTDGDEIVMARAVANIFHKFSLSSDMLVSPRSSEIIVEFPMAEQREHVSSASVLAKFNEVLQVLMTTESLHFSFQSSPFSVSPFICPIARFLEKNDISIDFLCDFKTLSNDKMMRLMATVIASNECCNLISRLASRECIDKLAEVSMLGKYPRSTSRMLDWSALPESTAMDRSSVIRQAGNSSMLSLSSAKSEMHRYMTESLNIDFATSVIRSQIGALTLFESLGDIVGSGFNIITLLPLLRNQWSLLLREKAWANPYYVSNSETEALDDNIEGLHRLFDREIYIVAKLLIKCIQLGCRDADVLMDLCRCLVFSLSVDVSFVRSFIRIEICKSISLSDRVEIVSKIVNALSLTEMPIDVRVCCIREALVPLLISCFQEEMASSPAVDPEIVRSVVTGIICKSVSVHNNALHVELLKLSAAVTRYKDKDLWGVRKELIRFSWDHFKYDDSHVKLWAYIAVCQFISKFDIPSKLIYRLFVLLLRSYHVEQREYANFALNILIPSFSERIQDSRDFVKTMRTTKKVIYEEGNSLMQLSHAWSAVVRHASVFYCNRHYFVPSMISSLSKIGLQQSISLENRVLAVGIADCIISWEVLRQARLKLSTSAAGAHAADVSSTEEKKTEANDVTQHTDRSPSFPPVQLFDDVYVPPTPQLEILCSFLVHLAALNVDSKDQSLKRLSAESVALFSRVFSVFETHDLKLPSLTSLLRSAMPKTSALGMLMQITAQPSVAADAEPVHGSVSPEMTSLFLQLIEISIVSKGKLADFMLLNDVALRNLILRAMCIVNRSTQRNLQFFVGSLVKHYPPYLLSQTTSSVNAIYQAIKGGIEKCLHSVTKRLVELQNSNPKVVPSEKPEQDDVRQLGLQAVTLIRIMTDHDFNFISNHGVSLLHLAQRISSHHWSSSSRNSGSNDKGDSMTHNRIAAVSSMVLLSEAYNGGPISIPKPDEYLKILLTCINLLGKALSISLLLDYRKQILQLIVDSLDFSDCVPILIIVIDIASGWVLSSHAPLSIQEKILLLGKMENFDRIIPESTAQPLLRRSEQLYESLLRKNDDPAFFWLKDSEALQKSGYSTLLSCHSDIRCLALERLAEGLNGLNITSKVQLLLSRLLEFRSTVLVGRMWLLLIPLGIFLGCLPSCLDSFLANSSGTRRIAVSATLLQNLTTLSRGRLDVIEFLTNLVFRLLVKGLDQACWEIAFAKLLARCCDSNQRLVVTIPSSLYYLGCTVNAESVNVPQRLLNSLFSIGYPELENFLFRSIDIVSYIALKFGVWGNLIDFLQSRLNYDLGHGISSQSQQVVSTLRYAFQEAGWRNLELGLCQLYSRRAQTRLIISRNQYYLDSETFLLCSNAMKAEVDKEATEYSWNDKFEYSQWERTWVDSAKRLGEWDAVQEFGKKTHRSLLVADSCSILSELQLLDSLRSCSSLMAEQELGVSSRKFIEAQLLAMQGKQSEIDRICHSCCQLALQKWQSCPPITTVGDTRRGLLVLFQRIVEFKESISLILDMLRPVESRSSLPSLIVSTWKSRSPCVWEEVPVWESILSWRSCTFQSLTEEQKSGHLADCGFQTSIAMARAARGSHAYQTALNYIAKIGKVDFAKTSTLKHEYLVENLSSLICVHEKKDEAIQVIEGSLTSHVSDAFKSDMCCFKAKLAVLANSSTDANACFSQSAQLNQANYTAWSAWGQFCDQQLKKDDGSNVESKTLMSLSTLAALLRAMSLDAKSSGIMASRCISLITEDDERLFSSLIKLFNQFYSEIQAFVWLPFLDFLTFSSFFQSERAFVSLVVCISKSHPFLVFQSLRRHQLSCYGDRATFSLSGARKSIDDRIISSIMHQSFNSWACVLRSLSFHKEIDSLKELAPVDVVHYSRLVSLINWLLRLIEERKKRPGTDTMEEKEVVDEVRGKRKRQQSDTNKIQLLSLQPELPLPDIVNQKIWEELTEFLSLMTSQSPDSIFVSNINDLLSSFHSLFGYGNMNALTGISVVECLRLLEKWSFSIKNRLLQNSFSSFAEFPDHCSSMEVAVSLQTMQSSLTDVVGDGCSFIGTMVSDSKESISPLSVPHACISLPSDLPSSFHGNEFVERIVSVYTMVRFVIDPSSVNAIVAFKSDSGHLRRYRLTFSTWCMEGIFGGDVVFEEQQVKRTRMSSASSIFLLPCFMLDWSNAYLQSILLMLSNNVTSADSVCQRENIIFYVPRVSKPSYHGLLVEYHRKFARTAQYSVEHLVDTSLTRQIGSSSNSQMIRLLEPGSADISSSSTCVIDEIRKLCRHAEDFWMRKRFLSRTFGQLSFMLMCFHTDLSSSKQRSILVDVSSGFVTSRDFMITIPILDNDVVNSMISRNGLCQALTQSISPLQMKGITIPTIGMCAMSFVSKVDSVHAVLELVLHLVKQDKLHDNISCSLIADAMVSRLKWMSPHEYRASMEEADEHLTQIMRSKI